MSLLTAWVWLFIALMPLLLLERWIHRHMQGIGLLLTRDHDLASVFYAAVFFPGVALHEISHWLMAKLLGVKTARISLSPRRLPDGTLRLGYVETAKVDVVREALIGVAPLVAGSAAVVLIGSSRLAVDALGAAIAAGDAAAIVRGAASSFRSADSLIWLYLIFAVSNSMMPSASDRRAWLPVSALLILVGVALYYLGAAPLVLQSVGEPVASGVRVVASAFTITLGVDAIMIPLLWLAERGLVRITGFKINY